MKRIGLFALLAGLLAMPVMAQGRIDTLPRGQYVCELPGDAGGSAGIEQPDENFSIVSASRYVVEGGSGTYLRRGDRVVLTSGPRNGDSYAIISEGFLRKIENGEPGRLRCIREGR